jgi:hypothetical protein
VMVDIGCGAVVVSPRLVVEVVAWSPDSTLAELHAVPTALASTMASIGHVRVRALARPAILTVCTSVFNGDQVGRPGRATDP